MKALALEPLTPSKPAAARLRSGEAFLLKRTKVEVTLRARSNSAEAVVIEDEARPYMVTINDGPCAGLRLWTAERELLDRPK